MIKIVIFDFGGVLGSESDAWERNFRKIVKITGLTPYELDEIFDVH